MKIGERGSPDGPPYGRSRQYYRNKLDVLGSLYLAYDLLGGQHGPLRLLTRAVTYSIVFGIGYGIGLGLFLASPRVSRQASPCPQSGSPWPRPLSFALGSTVQRHPRGCFWRRTGRMLGLSIRNRIWHSHHHRASIRLFSRHASRNRLYSVPSFAHYASSVLGNCRPDGRLHWHGASLQCSRESCRPRVVFCDPSRAGGRSCHRHRSDGKPLHRIYANNLP